MCAWRRPRGSAHSAPRRASMSSSAATLTARRRTTIATASERCVCARASTICARVSGETQRTNGAATQQTRCGARTKAAPLDPDVPHERAKLVLNPQGSQRRASRRLPPFPAQVALRAFAADEKPREVARLIGEVLAVLSHHVAVSRPRGACRLARNSRNRTSSEKKSEARRSVAASLVQAIWGGVSTLAQPTVGHYSDP